jgi:hypothetical protein
VTKVANVQVKLHGIVVPFFYDDVRIVAQTTRETHVEPGVLELVVVREEK